MDWMKRGVIYLVVLAIPFGGLAYTLPRRSAMVLHGIEYRLGEYESHKPVNVHIEGTFQRRFLAHSRFRGTMTIDGRILKDMDMTLNPDGSLMMYRNVETEKMERYGALYSDGSLTSFTIAVLEPIVLFGFASDDTYWDPANGLMISVPANTREEALQITNDLLAHLVEEPLE